MRLWASDVRHRAEGRPLEWRAQIKTWKTDGQDWKYRYYTPLGFFFPSQEPFYLHSSTKAELLNVRGFFWFFVHTVDAQLKKPSPSAGTCSTPRLWGRWTTEYNTNKNLMTLMLRARKAHKTPLCVYRVRLIAHRKVSCGFWLKKLSSFPTTLISKMQRDQTLIHTISNLSCVKGFFFGGFFSNKKTQICRVLPKHTLCAWWVLTHAMDD